MEYGDDKEKYESIFKKYTNSFFGYILSITGFHPAQMYSDDREVHEEAEVRREKTIESLNTLNESLLSVVPGGEVGYKMLTDQEIAEGDIAWEAASLIPGVKFLKKGGKAIKILNKVTFATKSDPTMLKFAKETFKGNKKLSEEASHLLNQAAQGNFNAGRGARFIEGTKGIHELRGYEGARVYFRNTTDGIEVLGYSHKGNQTKVINYLKTIYK